MWAYNLMVNNIVRSKYIFVENNKIEILFSNYIFGLTFESNLQSSFIYKKLDKILKLINIQLKFIKEDKTGFLKFKQITFCRAAPFVEDLRN